jgi:hypothetical protein
MAKFVGTYTNESAGIVIVIDIHQGKLFAKMSMFPKGHCLTPVTDNRFRIEGRSDITFLDFQVVSEKVNGLTLEQGEGKPAVKLRWNP